MESREEGYSQICFGDIEHEENSGMATNGNAEDNEKTKADATTSSDKNQNERPRIQLCNLPPYSSYKQIKDFLAKVLSTPAWKIRSQGNKAYFSVNTECEAEAAITALNGYKLKNRILKARPACPLPEKKIVPRAEQPAKRTAREIVSPLADIAYSEQLEIKCKSVKTIVEKLIKQMKAANVCSDNQFSVDHIVRPIIPSPKTTRYRNKCEFTVGRDVDGNVCVGFVTGRFTANEHFIIPVDTCDNISEHMKRVVKAFQSTVIDSGEPPFNEETRKGFWRMLAVREFGCDTMMIVNVFPTDNEEKKKSLQSMIIERFLRFENLTDQESQFRVTSLFWQELENASDPVIYEHIGGAPYIYETILGVRFRVSPSSFFQTNSLGAEVLYKTVAEKCGLLEESSASKSAGDCGNDIPLRTVDDSFLEFPDDSCNEEEEPSEKVPKLEGSEDSETKAEETSNGGTVILDICCGTGTIGITLMKHAKSARRYLLGIELVEDAVEDAKTNASGNDLPSECYTFVAAKAEDVFYRIERYLPAWAKSDSIKVIGVLNPPRAGVHEKVIIGCRAMSRMNKIIFISCNPSMAMKNMINLCRPTSKKFSGEPFRITSITPIDMFPQTHHCEWLVELER